MSDIPPVIKQLKDHFGNSNDNSRNAVKQAHGGIENLQEAAMVWASHHLVVGSTEDLFIAYATAVDLGYRIGRHDANNPATFRQPNSLPPLKNERMANNGSGTPEA